MERKRIGRHRVTDCDFDTKKAKFSNEKPHNIRYTLMRTMSRAFAASSHIPHHFLSSLDCVGHMPSLLSSNKGQVHCHQYLIYFFFGSRNDIKEERKHARGRLWNFVSRDRELGAASTDEELRRGSWCDFVWAVSRVNSLVFPPR